MGRRRSEQTTTMLPLPEAAAVDVVSSATPDPMPAPHVIESAPSSAPVSAWRVKTSKRVSWYGHLTLMPAGKVVSLTTCGPDGLARLREQGVELEPMV